MFRLEEYPEQHALDGNYGYVEDWTSASASTAVGKFPSYFASLKKKDPDLVLYLLDKAKSWEHVPQNYQKYIDDHHYCMCQIEEHIILIEEYSTILMGKFLEYHTRKYPKIYNILDWCTPIQELRLDPTFNNVYMLAFKTRERIPTLKLRNDAIVALKSLKTMKELINVRHKFDY